MNEEMSEIYRSIVDQYSGLSDDAVREFLIAVSNSLYASYGNVASNFKDRRDVVKAFSAIPS